MQDIVMGDIVMRSRPAAGGVVINSVGRGSVAS